MGGTPFGIFHVCMKYKLHCCKYLFKKSKMKVLSTITLTNVLYMQNQIVILENEFSYTIILSYFNVLLNS